MCVQLRFQLNMNERYQKTDEPDLIKDTATGALINTNKEGLRAYKARKLANSRLDKLETDVLLMKSQLNDIQAGQQAIIDALINKGDG